MPLFKDTAREDVLTKSHNNVVFLGSVSMRSAGSSSNESGFQVFWYASFPQSRLDERVELLCWCVLFDSVFSPRDLLSQSKIGVSLCDDESEA